MNAIPPTGSISSFSNNSEFDHHSVGHPLTLNYLNPSSPEDEQKLDSPLIHPAPSFLNLPLEVLTRVLHALSRQDIAALLLISRQTYHNVVSDVHWQRYLKQEFHPSVQMNSAHHVSAIAPVRGKSAMQLFFTELAARKGEKLTHIFNEIKKLRESGLSNFNEEIINLAKADLEVAEIILDFKEVENFLDHDVLYQMTLLHKKVALIIMDRDHLFRKLMYSDLFWIAAAHEEFALVVFEREDLIEELNAFHLPNIAKSHEKIAFIVLKRKDLLERLDHVDLFEIAREQEKFALAILERAELIEKMDFSELLNLAIDNEIFHQKFLEKKENFKEIYDDEAISNLVFLMDYHTKS